MATRKAKTASAKIEPSTVKGNHLTVITDNFGKTTLVWDDEALLKEVRAAIASAGHVDREDIPAPRVNSNPPKKPAAKKAPAKKTVKKTTKE